MDTMSPPCLTSVAPLGHNTTAATAPYVCYVRNRTFSCKEALKHNSRTYYYIIGCADKLIKSRTSWKGLAVDKTEKGLGLTPHRSMIKVTPY